MYCAQRALPVGFRSSDEAHYNISHILIRKMRAAEPARWQDQSDEELLNQLEVDVCVERVLMHHRIVTDVIQQMYEDVAYKLSPVPRDVAALRAKVRVHHLLPLPGLTDTYSFA